MSSGTDAEADGTEPVTGDGDLPAASRRGIRVRLDAAAWSQCTGQSARFPPQPGACSACHFGAGVALPLAGVMAIGHGSPWVARARCCANDCATRGRSFKWAGDPRDGIGQSLPREDLRVLRDTTDLGWVSGGDRQQTAEDSAHCQLARDARTVQVAHDLDDGGSAYGRPLLPLCGDSQTVQRFSRRNAGARCPRICRQAPVAAIFSTPPPLPPASAPVVYRPAARRSASR